MTAADDLRLTVSWFENAVPIGQQARGDPETLTWGNFVSISAWRREGEKDGCGFVPSRFKLEADGRQIRRLKANLIARTAVALDIEANKKTGEVPPSLDEVTARVRSSGLACLGYSSHNHRNASDPRYRLVMPLSEEISADSPAPQIMAAQLGLAGVVDLSKVSAASLFYLPSCPPNALDLHQTVVVAGEPIAAGWVRELTAARQIEADRAAAQANAEAAAYRETKKAAGFNPDDSLIDKFRSHSDLGSILLAHGYDQSPDNKRYRHPNSSSGIIWRDYQNLRRH
jgi:hypothetical protein